MVRPTQTAPSPRQPLNGQGVLRIPGLNASAHKAREGGVLRVCTVNIGSMTGRGVEVVDMLARRGADVCCVQETQFKGNSAKIYSTGEQSYKFLWAGEEERRGGVGIFVKEDLLEDVVEVRRRSARVMAMSLIIGGRYCHVFSVYGPQSGKSQEEKDRFFEELDDELGRIPPEQMLYVGGDLNGHVGTERQGFEEVMGPFGFGERNREGESILRLCQSRELLVVNTMFKKEKEKLVTYKSGGAETQIDYILARKQQGVCIKDCKVIPGEECVTQHRLLCMTLEVKSWKRPRKRKAEKKIKVWKLREQSISQRYKEEVRAGSQENGGWNEFRDNILEAGKTVCGITSGNILKKRETWWWNQEVQKAIREKRKAFKIWQKDEQPGSREIYREKKRIAKREVAKAKHNAYTEWSRGRKTAEQKKEMFKVAKQMRKDNKDVAGGRIIKDSGGQILIEEDKIKIRWKEYFQQLLNERNEYQIEEMEMVNGPIERVKEEEVSRAMKEMSNNKAAGPSGVTSELLVGAGETGVKKMTEIMNNLVGGEKIPDDWRSSITCPIYKGKGDSMECGKHRGVRLLEHGMKLYERVLEKRLRSLINIGEYQFGFCPGRSTTGAIYIMRQIQEKYRQKKKKLFHVFVDLEKAFDRVPREVIVWALRRQKVPERLVRAVMQLYEGTRSRVKTSAGMSEEFPIEVGVHQGSVLSPLLFITVMEEATVAARDGGPWELAYADDLVLTGQTKEEVIRKFEVWKHAMEGRGLKVNMEKTMAMVTGGKVEKIDSGRWPCSVCGSGVGGNSIQCVQCSKWCHGRCSRLRRVVGVTGFRCPTCVEGGGNRPEEEFEVGEERLKVVSKFCYLGDMMDSDAGSERAVRVRVAAAWQKWREIASLLLRKFVPLKVRASIYEACVRSVMLYGSETWALTEKEMGIIRSSDMRMLRYMASVRWEDRVSNEEVAGRCGLEMICRKLRRRRLQWFGHVCRAEDGSLLKMTSNMQAPGVRPPGRPRRGWKQIVEGDMKSLGLREEMTADRAEWRRAIGRPTPLTVGTGGR